jgi:LmbE family N-acetylglucosaminyl deacetylase
MIASDLPPIDATTSLLVVSPHPDDETLCCAGVIRRVVTAGGRVSVVWITSGDGSWLSMLLVEKSLFETRDKARDLAAKRVAEARAATALLGVDGARQFFLGYPDGSVRKLLIDHRSSLERDFTAVLDRVQPTLILAPSPADTHPDHAASGLLTIAALRHRGELSKARYWIVHGGEGWPRPRGLMQGIPLNIPPRGDGLALRPFALTEDEETSKLQAVNAYHTQMKVMAPFLLAFVRTSELFSAIPVRPPVPATP